MTSGADDAGVGDTNLSFQNGMELSAALPSECQSSINMPVWSGLADPEPQDILVAHCDMLNHSFKGQMPSWPAFAAVRYPQLRGFDLLDTVA